MRTLAYALIALGFVLAALVTVQTPGNQVAWAKYLSALIPGMAGVFMARLASHQKSRHSERLQADFQRLVTSLDRLVAHAVLLDEERTSFNPGDIHRRIDTLCREDLNRFADARESISHLHGLQAYAEVMNEFAAGERYLNRVWSASVDGYVDEVREYLARARYQFVETQAALNRYLPTRPGNAPDQSGHRETQGGIE